MKIYLYFILALFSQFLFVDIVEAQIMEDADYITLKEKLFEYRNSPTAPTMQSVDDSISHLLHLVIYEKNDSLVSRKEKLDILLYARHIFFDNKLSFFRKVVNAENKSIYFQKNNTMYFIAIVFTGYVYSDIHKEVFKKDFAFSIEDVPEFYRLFFSIIIEHYKEQYQPNNNRSFEESPSWGRFILRIIVNSYLFSHLYSY